MELLNYSRSGLIRLMADRYGKAPYHGDALFRHLYARGELRPTEDPLFARNLPLAEALERDFPLRLPRITRINREEGALKFCLDLHRELSCETVLIPMKNYATLCVSSQLGCRWACGFCETGRLGLARNLSTAEIMAQIISARFGLQTENLRNLVFMGMGEPLENLPAVVGALDILSDPRGLNMPLKRVSLSTAGYVPGLRELSRLCREEPEKHYGKLHLSLSLHSADPAVRSRLMPINRAYPLDLLKRSLLESPYSRVKDGLYIEYILLPGVTDSPGQIEKLLVFLEGMDVKVNLIPYNPGRDPLFRKPEQEEIDRFGEALRREGYPCRTRVGRGESVMAACGQLGNRSKPNEYSGCGIPQDETGLSHP